VAPYLRVLWNWALLENVKIAALPVLFTIIKIADITFLLLVNTQMVKLITGSSVNRALNKSKIHAGMIYESNTNNIKKPINVQYVGMLIIGLFNTIIKTLKQKTLV
tara:strand:+ start:265 stop:582 length:318 start_codon:yes stop_codon:yes gene_type:complete